MQSFLPQEIPVAKLHGLMLGSIGPRPIAFASTIDADGSPNLAPYSFFNVFSANPPVLIFSPARRVRDNTIKHTLENVQATKEVVINIVNYALVQQMSLASTEYPKGVNEFIKSGLRMLPSEVVKPFRVAEAPVQYECKVTDIIALGEAGGAGNLIFCEVVKLHIDEKILTPDGHIDPLKIDLVARMGGDWYTRAAKGLFEVEKPLRTKGVGVDALPEAIRHSNVLTGNDLGRLGNIEALPTVKELDAFKAANKSIVYKHKTLKLEALSLKKKHKIAQHWLKKGRSEDALKLLMC